MLLQTLAIPRGQTAMALGKAAHDAKEFELVATRGETVNGVNSNPFLEQAFRTDEYRIKVTIHDDGTWSYEQDTVLKIEGADKVFHHIDRNRLTRVAEATANPLALQTRREAAG